MEELNDLLKQISENLLILEKLKERSEEAREALDLQAEQERLVKRLTDKCREATPQIVPMPYPVYPPGFPWVTPYPAPWHPWITISTDCGTLQLPAPYKVIS